jgi:phosphatidylglycerophosphatase A
MNSLISLAFSLSLALLLSGAIFLYLDASTLFLAALLLAVVAFKTENKHDVLDKVSALMFALSVAPAKGVAFAQMSDLSNGFVVQILMTFVAFIYFYRQKPSIIGKLHKAKNLTAGVVLSSTIAGFAAGISSAVLWQIYLQIAL